MTRAYDEFVAAVFDVVPAPLVLLILFVVTALVAALWHWFPAWAPRRLPRLRAPRLRLRFPRLRLPRLRLPRLRLPRLRLPRLRLPGYDWRRLLLWRRWAAWWRTRKNKAEPEPAAVPPTATPAAPATRQAPAHLALADRLAAQGRYAEAIRQRLRDTVAELTSAGVIAPQPSWTAAELARAATASRPGIGPALDGATAIFSEIWYGKRPALAGHDERMRDLTAQVRAGLGVPR